MAHKSPSGSEATPRMTDFIRDAKPEIAGPEAALARSLCPGFSLGILGMRAREAALSTRELVNPDIMSTMSRVSRKGRPPGTIRTWGGAGTCDASATLPLWRASRPHPLGKRRSSRHMQLGGRDVLPAVRGEEEHGLRNVLGRNVSTQHCFFRNVFAHCLGRYSAAGRHSLE